MWQNKLFYEQGKGTYLRNLFEDACKKNRQISETKLFRANPLCEREPNFLSLS